MGTNKLECQEQSGQKRLAHGASHGNEDSLIIGLEIIYVKGRKRNYLHCLRP